MRLQSGSSLQSLLELIRDSGIESDEPECEKGLKCFIYLIFAWELHHEALITHAKVWSFFRH